MMTTTPWSLATLAILATVVGGQLQRVREESQCEEESTVCVVITQCPRLLQLLKQVKEGSAGPSAKREIFSNHCGFQDALPKVCCAVQIVPTTTTVPPVTNTLITKTTTTTISSTSFIRDESTTNIINPSIEANNSLNAKNADPAQTRENTTPFTTTAATTVATTTTTEPTTTTTTTSTTTTTTPPESVEVGVRSSSSDFSHLNSPQCGTRTALTLRITLGQAAVPGQFPWMASLQYRRRPGGRAVPLCGGALISSRHVITAAHCHATQAGYRLSSVRLGQVDISKPVQGDGMEVDIESVVSHPDFQQNPVAINDVALIHLSHPVQFTDYIRPVCVHHPSPSLLASPPGGLVVAGWGRTERATSSPTLQYTDLAALSPTDCQGKYDVAAAAGQLGPGIPSLSLLSSQLCATGEDKTDSCSGDSGGPLLASIGRKWFIAGVVSFGTQRCDSSLPGVYTRVASYLPWLEEAMATAVPL